MSVLPFVVYALLCSALLAVVATCLEALFGARRWPLRWIWMVAIAMSVTIPLLFTLRKATPPPPALDSSSMADLGKGAAIVTLSQRASQESIVATTEVLAQRLESTDPALRVALWSSLLIVPLLIGIEWVRLRIAQRRWREDSLCGVDVLVADAFGPAVVGVVAPRIVVPAFALELPARQQQLLLTHEEEHVRADDGRWSLAMLLLVALAPWNLFVWWQYSRLRLAIELDCDARVLAHGESPRAYGTLLIDMAARSQRASLVATAFLERYTSSLQRRIAHITQASPAFRRANRVRMTLAAVLGTGTLPLIFILPPPPVHQAPRTAAQFVADSGAIAVMELNRARRWKEAEGTGLGFLAARPPSSESGESCAVLIGVTYAQAMLQKRTEAKASMARFDERCINAVYVGFIPAESDRVRRLVNGEDSRNIWVQRGDTIPTRVGGATSVMTYSREGRYAEAERTGLSFLASMERRPREPEACAVLIGVTFAQAAMRRSDDAKQSLARFDRECKGVMYLDWFPAEAERVRRVVNGERPTDVYKRVPTEMSR